MTPRLAICFPSAPTEAGAKMLRRSVQALFAQDCEPGAFEVCVGVDGDDGPDMLDAMGPRDLFRDSPFSVGFSSVKRTPGYESVPHRNHARNAAWRAARAPLCWMLDADFILPPHAVRHLLAEHDAAIERGAPAVFSPCLWQFGGASTEEWWARSAPWVETEGLDASVAAFKSLLKDWPEWDRGVFSGFGELATNPIRSAASVSVGNRMIEGMPILWRAFLEACPFDERFIGWGGDKISLIDVLRGLCREGILDIRVLTSVAALHQPHPTDPTHVSELSRANEKRRTLARMPIESRTLEWKRRIPVLVDGLRKGWAAASVGALPPGLGSVAELAPVLEILATMAKRRAKPPAPIMALGAYAGVIAAHLERAGLGPVLREATNAPHAVAVMVDPLDAHQGDLRARVEALGHHLRATLHPTAAVVLAQRLDGPGLEGLRPVDIQTHVIRQHKDARALKVGPVRFTAICGRL